MKVWGSMINPSIGQNYMDFTIDVVMQHSKARSIFERYLS